MKHFTLAVGVVLVFVICSTRAVADPTTQPVSSPTPVKDPDATLRANMRDQWSHLERHLWQIEFKPIAGMENKSEWHVKGTHWWVALYPSVFKLDELDK